jgi:hypothetical protein
MINSSNQACERKAPEQRQRGTRYIGPRETEPRGRRSPRWAWQQCEVIDRADGAWDVVVAEREGGAAVEAAGGGRASDADLRLDKGLGTAIEREAADHVLVSCGGLVDAADGVGLLTQVCGVEAAAAATTEMLGGRCQITVVVVVCTQHAPSLRSEAAALAFAAASDQGVLERA